MEVSVVVGGLKKVLGWFEKEAQVEMERILRAWMAGRPAKGVRYSTDGESVFYFGSEVLRGVPGGFEISNQGWVTSTTRKVLNTILDYIARPGRYRVFIRGGEMGLEDMEEGIRYAFPTGRNVWVRFDERGELVSKLELFEKKGLLPSDVLRKIFEDIRTKFRLGADEDEIKIPGTNWTLREIYALKIQPLRGIYHVVPTFRDATEKKFTEDLVWHDLRYVLRRMHERGQLDIEKAIEELGLR